MRIILFRTDGYLKLYVFFCVIRVVTISSSYQIINSFPNKLKSLPSKFCKSFWYKSDHCVKSIQIRSFFWSVFSRIRTEYGEILRISTYSVRMREKTDQKKFRIWTLFTQWTIKQFQVFYLMHILIVKV